MELIANNIEQIENVVELLALAVAVVCVMVKQTWPSDDVRLFTRGLFGIGFLADLYWTVFTLVFGYTPPYFYVAELGWLAQELFLLLLIIEVYHAEGGRGIHPLSWIAPVIIAALTIWYIVATGSFVTNALQGATLAGVAVVSLSAILYGRKEYGNGDKTCRCLYVFSLVYVIAEHIIWSCSVLDSSVSISNPYYWFDPLLVVSLVGLLVCTMRFDKRREGDVA